MVLLVPDDTEETTAALAEDVSEESGQQPKAQLDDSEASRAAQKVDLDLDDAPFLEAEEEDELPLEEEHETPLFEEEKPEKSNLAALLGNKLVWAAAVIVILLAVIAILLLREPEVVEVPVEVPPVAQPETPAEPVVPESQDILVRLDPFLVEQKDDKGQVRFLEVRLVLTTPDDGLARQFKQETYTVRNAVYYYLKNKDLQFLSDKKNSDRLKKELLAVINQYMGFGQFETLLFEQYLVR
ncbi:flagellar basal body-associated FliL family protein [Pseudodesulfovibrio tunisiensis]|uniref:flagellar basal body-associated FliL family protein n=1 Tax=Pseudodesulfovibrio tunisiensis TaxID=463192 RepID=UPI001FB31357|nr:flagellar basal body-associated FliL family protein [Pseudodesulfovibrio tunisiensis]